MQIKININLTEHDLLKSCDQFKRAEVAPYLERSSWIKICVKSNRWMFLFFFFLSLLLFISHSIFLMYSYQGSSKNFQFFFTPFLGKISV